MGTEEHSSGWKFDYDVLILGAGASVALTRGEMPVMSNFFEALKEEEYPNLSKALHCLGDGKQANVEQLLLALDQFGRSPSIILEHCSHDVNQDDLPIIRRELGRYSFDRLTGPRKIFINWASKFLISCTEKTTILTLNYDNLAEVVLSRREGLSHCGSSSNCPHCKMYSILDQTCGCHVDAPASLDETMWRGALLKLHGSVAWTICDNSDCCKYNCIVPDRQCRPQREPVCAYCGSSTRHVMIMPSLGKTLNEFSELRVMWDCAAQALKDARKIGILGFSFPTSDELFCQIFRAGARERPYERIDIIDLFPENVSSRLRSCSLLENTEIREYAVEGNGFAAWCPNAIAVSYPPIGYVSSKKKGTRSSP